MVCFLAPSRNSTALRIPEPNKGLQENIGIGKLKREETDPHPSPLQLPSSFANLVLGIVDSPAYANLRTSYLTDEFNPQTPDDPRVKYFSVAGRMPGVNVWHPFWLPKMVLDGVEARERQRQRQLWESGASDSPLWSHDREWGNDGLVTVQSAKWGEFLGIMEGCDHWEMRGARGLEFGVALPAIPAIGLSPSSNSSPSQGDGWGLMDWGRFGSTEKASSAFDWLLEQVPSVPLLGGAKSGKTQAVEDARRLTEAEVGALHGDGKKEKVRKKAELASKADLERFYCRVVEEDHIL
ncbi:hypothetical protein C8F01DRAFT_1372423 [Mycena amicta]|nr:hypothetical protein C8F01DRAFT_1372423 [Mycena amicta]